MPWPLCASAGPCPTAAQTGTCRGRDARRGEAPLLGPPGLAVVGPCTRSPVRATQGVHAASLQPLGALRGRRVVCRTPTAVGSPRRAR